MEKKRVLVSVVLLNSVLITGAFLGGALLWAAPNEALSEAARALPEGVMQWGFVSAALAVGIGAIGAGIAVGLVGAAAMGTIGERPEMVGRVLIFVGLAEGIAIYGLIIAIMILGRL